METSRRLIPGKETWYRRVSTIRWQFGQAKYLAEFRLLAVSSWTARKSFIVEPPYTGPDASVRLLSETGLWWLSTTKIRRCRRSSVWNRTYCLWKMNIGVRRQSARTSALLSSSSPSSSSCWWVVWRRYRSFCLTASMIHIQRVTVCTQLSPYYLPLKVYIAHNNNIKNGKITVYAKQVTAQLYQAPLYYFSPQNRRQYAWKVLRSLDHDCWQVLRLRANDVLPNIKPRADRRRGQKYRFCPWCDLWFWHSNSSEP